VREGGGGVLMNAVSDISDIRTRWRNSIKIRTPIQISRWRNTQPDTHTHKSRFFMIIKASSPYFISGASCAREHKAYGPIIRPRSPGSIYGPQNSGACNSCSWRPKKPRARERKLNSKGVDDGKRKTRRQIRRAHHFAIVQE
jgi:hypothetical protein